MCYKVNRGRGRRTFRKVAGYRALPKLGTALRAASSRLVISVQPVAHVDAVEALALVFDSFRSSVIPLWRRHPFRQRSASSKDSPANRRLVFWEPGRLVLPLFLLLSGIRSAQTSPGMETSPGAGATPGAGHSGATMAVQKPPGMAVEDPQMGLTRPCPPGFRHHRGGLIVTFVLGALLALSGSFALTAPGIFRLRRSNAGTRVSALTRYTGQSEIGGVF